MSQKQQIIERLRQGPATALDLLRDCGSLQAATRIFELKELGYEIDGPMINVKSSNGIKKVKSYALISEPKLAA